MASRLITILLWIFLFHQAPANSYEIFEKGGFFGIKNQSGEIQVPAVYQKLGWSDGTGEIVSGVIGYRQGRTWGLVSVKNKIIVGDKFHSIEPVSGNLFKVSVQGKFSNHLFYGVIDQEGEPVVSITYSGIKEREPHLFEVEVYEAGKNLKGILDSKKGSLLIPVKYRKIHKENSYYSAFDQLYRIDLYSATGQQLVSGLDSLSFGSKSIRLYRGGKQGLLDDSGNQLFPVEFKSIIKIHDQFFANQFPLWSVYQDKELIFSHYCDSISMLPNGSWIIYFNERSRLIYPGISALNQSYSLRNMVEDKLIVTDNNTGKWFMLDSKGNRFLSAYDSLIINDPFIYGLTNGVWDIFSEYGTRINRFQLEVVKGGIGGQHIIKKNKFWGILDLDGSRIANFIFDEVRIVNGFYHVKFLNNWGILDSLGNWQLSPDFSEVGAKGRLAYGKRGNAYHIFMDKELISKTVDQPIRWVGDQLVLQNEQGYFRLLANNSFYSSTTYYEEIHQKGEYVELKKDGYCELYHQTGKKIISTGAQVEAIGAINEDRISIKINGLWGHLDMQGKLRISNRYDSVKAFSNGFAPFKIRGKWGVLNLEDRIVAQPHYEEILPFYGDVAVVKKNGLYGLLNYQGDEVIPCTHPVVKRYESGNYLILTKDSEVGLIDPAGRYLLMPSYDKIVDKGKIVISKAEKYGVLKTDGTPLFNMDYDDARIYDSYVALKLNQKALTE